MKVLSVRQPYARALIHGGKDVENRTWFTNYRGLLAIHAGKQFDFTKGELKNAQNGDYGEPWTTLCQTYETVPDVRGAIVGVVELYDCIPDAKCRSIWKADGHEFYCWLVRNPIALRDPIPMVGRLGLWDVPDSLFPEVKTS